MSVTELTTSPIALFLSWRTFIYIIECRELYGNIAVNQDGEFFRKVKIGNKVVREAIESPLVVGENHKAILKRVWASKIEAKNKTKFEKAFNKSYKILAVVTGTSNSNLDAVETGLRKKVIKCENLIDYIEKDLEKFYSRKDLIDSKEEMHGQAYRLMDLNVDHYDDYEEKYKKMFKLENKKIVNTKKVTKKAENPKQPIKKDSLPELKNSIIVTKPIVTIAVNPSVLRKKLVSYRIKKYKQNDVPADYIFTDDELDLIISKMPRSIDELKRKRILTPVKIKMFGDDIIKIINTKTTN